MFNQDYLEKTEPASPRKREEARKRGYVPLSTELNSALFLSGFFIGLSFLLFFTLAQFKQVFKYSLNKIAFSGLNLQSFYSLFAYGSISFFKIVLPLTILPIALAVICHLLQTNFLVTFKPLFSTDGRFGSTAGQSSGISPSLSRVFSKKTIYEGIKFSVKIGIISLLGYLLIREELPNLATLSDRGTDELLSYFSSILFKLGLRIVVVLVLFGIGDFLFQRWQYEKEMKMTREELKRELREEEGSPEMKGAFRDFMAERK